MNTTLMYPLCKAVLLAGGKSTRMGGDKALLSWQGQSLLQHQWQMLNGLFLPENIWVSGNREGFPHILDQITNAGPLVGVYSALQKLLQEKTCSDFSILFVPVDMPFLNEKSIAKLYSFSCGEAFACDGVYFSGYELPVLILNPEKFFKIIEAMLVENNSQLESTVEGKKKSLSFKELYKKLNMKMLSADEDIKSLQNLNTRREFDEALSTTNHST